MYDAVINWKVVRSISLLLTVLTLGEQAISDASNALNVKPRIFDPYYFDLKETQRNLFDAINSAASVHSGSKVFVHNLQQMNKNEKSYFPEIKRKGQRQVKTFDR